MSASATNPRHCGECTLCCRLLPVRSLDKDAGKRCVHQRSLKGCAIYEHLPRVSLECKLWNCRWLTNDDTADFRRPDRSHYVLDIMPDYVTVTPPDGAPANFQVAQIWIDPAFPNAHDDPPLRAWLDRHKLIGLVRYGGDNSAVLVPPSLNNGQWFVKPADRNNANEHSFADIVRSLQAG